MTFESFLDAIREVFGLPGAQLDRSSTTDDVQGWDSLSHVILVIRLGELCGREIDAGETLELGTIGELYDFLQGKKFPVG